MYDFLHTVSRLFREKSFQMEYFCPPNRATKVGPRGHAGGALWRLPQSPPHVRSGHPRLCPRHLLGLIPMGPNTESLVPGVQCITGCAAAAPCLPALTQSTWAMAPVLSPTRTRCRARRACATFSATSVPHSSTVCWVMTPLVRLVCGGGRPFWAFLIWGPYRLGRKCEDAGEATVACGQAIAEWQPLPPPRSYR